MSAPNPSDFIITFDLGSVKNIGEMWAWNHNGVTRTVLQPQGG